jgi:glycopeptide antibiotics resistance protein
MSSNLARLAAWSCLLAVAIATVAPIEMRPETALVPSSERVTAFAIMGLLFAVAYPRKLWFAILMTIGAAVALELVQLLIPSRHGRVFDATVKMAGGAAGLLIGYLARRLLDLVPRN